MKISIRKAKLTDFDRIYQFNSLLAETEFNREIFHQIFKGNLKSRNIYYLVACNDDSVIGFVSLYVHSLLHHGGNLGEIAELFVDEKYRNRKTGSALVNSVIDIASKRNCCQVEVHSNRKRRKTHRFYIKEKFNRTHYKFTYKL